MASRVPYMVCPGNHEADHYGSFNNYIYRFRMPQYESSSNLWFSFQLGPVYFVAVSTEVYFFPAQMLAIPAQWQWLQAELARAQAQRDAYPWLIVYAHRPLYCSDRDSSTYTDCTADTEIVREGLLGKWGLESLLYEYGVDLYLCGHEHSYERLWPVYQSRVYNGSLEAPYTDPGAPIHIISGAAGNQEEFDVFGPPNSWSAFRSVTYGFGELTIFNSTVALWRQVLANGTGTLPRSFSSLSLFLSFCLHSSKSVSHSPRRDYHRQALSWALHDHLRGLTSLSLSDSLRSAHDRSEIFILPFRVLKHE